MTCQRCDSNPPRPAIARVRTDHLDVVVCAACFAEAERINRVLHRRALVTSLLPHDPERKDLQRALAVLAGSGQIVKTK